MKTDQLIEWINDEIELLADEYHNALYNNAFEREKHEAVIQAKFELLGEILDLVSESD